MIKKYDLSKAKELDEEILDNVLSSPIDEVRSELSAFGADEIDYLAMTKSFIAERIAQSRKQMLTDARAQIDQENSSSLLDSIIETADQAKDFIFQLIQSGELRNNKLTAAFRDGEDISDSDLIEMANDLKELRQSNNAED
jgi:hypothetical protein